MKKFFPYVVIAVLSIVLFFTARSCQNYKAKEDSYNKNIVALNDTIRSYKSKNGSVVSTTTTFTVEDYNDLQKLCSDLYEQIKDTKVKKATSAVSYKGIASATPTDTSWVIPKDTARCISKEFIFKDDYRELSGNVFLNMDTLGLNVKKDIFVLDYTVVFDNKSNVYVKTDNPYVQINEMKGFQIPRPKQKRWGIGVNTSYSFDVVNQRLTPTIGIGIQYNIINF